MEKKLAVYICKGCGLGDALNIEALQKVAESEYQAPICKTHDILCGPEGAAVIKKDVDEEGANAIVIAACSPRVMYDVFDYPDCLVDRVNLREQVVWSTEPNSDLAAPMEDIQTMAEDYLRMGLKKVEKMELPEPFQPEEEISKDILVIGGGVAGMTSALEASRAGYKVILVEKEAELGGFQKNVQRYITFPYKEISGNVVADMVQEIEASDKITVYTNAKVEQTAGGPCVFNVKIKLNGGNNQEQKTEEQEEETGEIIETRAGSIILATGWQPYDPTKLDDKLGYGRSPNVITNVRFEELAAQGKVTRPSDGQPLQNVAFLQCAGSRDPNYLPYCSSICCLASLKQAVTLKEQNPDCNVFIVYKELRTPGQAEDFYRAAQEAGVFFIRCQDPVVSSDGRLTVQAMDELLGEELEMPDMDLIVLATGMVPATGFGEDVKAELREAQEKQLKEREAAKAAAEARAKAEAEAAAKAPPKKGKKAKKGKKGKAKAAAEAEEEPLPVPLDYIFASECLNLEYRQGPELPDLKYGFPDSHFVCFPFESRRTGIFPAGCTRRAMGTASAFEDATGAAMKAIQCVEAVSKGQALHPRSGDLSFPEIYLSRCTQCRRCTDECPFGALNEDEKSNPLPVPTRCRRCGVCMGACPERIISFKNYNVDMIGSMIKQVSMPSEDEGKPRVLIFACENDAYPALDMSGMKNLKYSPYVRIIPLRCLGSLNLVWIADALGSGFDGVMLFGCRHGDDYQCHFVRGSELANIRMSKVTETLTRLGLEPERIRVEEISITDYFRIPDIINEFMETIVKVGANPFKDL